MSLHLVVGHILTYGSFIAALRLFTAGIGSWLAYRDSFAQGVDRSLGGFIRYCLPRQLFSMQSVRFDGYFFILSRVSGIWIVAAALAITVFMVPATYHALAATFGPHARNETTVPLQLALVLLCILVRDLGEFASHALMHRYDFLWEFHKVHHSSLFLTPLGAKRAHFVEDAIRTIPNITIVSVCIGIFTYVFSLGPARNTLFGIDAYALFNVLCFETLRHSHIPLSWGRLEAYLMSPLQHQVHHNRDGTVRNFGSFLACWDRAFGTFSRSLPKGSFEIGLDPADQPNYDSLAKLYLMPFQKAGYILLSWLNSRNSLDKQDTRQTAVAGKQNNGLARAR